MIYLLTPIPFAPKFNTIGIRNINSEIKREREKEVKLEEKIKMLNSRTLKKGVFRLFFCEIVFPGFCFRKNSAEKQRLANYDKYRDIIKDQLDIGNLFKKVMLIEKINYVLTGEKNMDIFGNCINPKYLENKNLKISDINNARQYILKRLNNYNE